MFAQLNENDKAQNALVVMLMHHDYRRTNSMAITGSEQRVTKSLDDGRIIGLRVIIFFSNIKWGGGNYLTIKLQQVIKRKRTYLI